MLPELSIKEELEWNVAETQNNDINLKIIRKTMRPKINKQIKQIRNLNKYSKKYRFIQHGLLLS